MHEEIAALVHPVLARGLDLKGRLDGGESPAFEVEQTILEGLLTGAVADRRPIDDEAPGPPGPAAGVPMGGLARRSAERLLTIRYALACWLDEVFILDSPWGPRWNEHKLEVALNGTNDRAWKFWELARRPETRLDRDVLEVFYLCVMLGFRGELRGKPDELRAWVSTARAQLADAEGLAWPAPPELDPPTHVPPLRGRERLQHAAMAGGTVLLVLIPLVAFFVVYQLGQ